MSKKLENSDVLKSDYELKIQNQHSHLRFMLTILIRISSAFKLCHNVQKSAYLTLIPVLHISEGVWETKT